MAKSKSTKSVTNVESIRHKDKRKNIPTEELRDFVAQDENAPKTMLYPAIRRSIRPACLRHAQLFHHEGLSPHSHGNPVPFLTRK